MPTLHERHVSLKHQSQRELDLPRVKRADGTSRFCERRIGILDVHAVEQIEHIGADVQEQIVVDWNFSGKLEINRCEAAEPIHIPAKVANRANGR